MAGLDNESATWVRSLPRGYAVLDGPVDPQIIAVPNTTREDVTRLIASPQTTSERSWESTSTTTSTTSKATSPEVESEVVDEADNEVDNEVDDLKRDRVRELLRQRVPASKIVREVWGVSGGDAYQRAAKEYSEIVAQIVGGA